jgi:hypothetical protein
MANLETVRDAASGGAGTAKSLPCAPSKNCSIMAGAALMT